MERPNEPVIVLDAVSAGYGRRSGPYALSDLSLAVPAGQRLGIIGPNGSGKSSLFRVILGLLEPAIGSVSVLGGRPSAAHRRSCQIGYVPQARAGSNFPITVGQMVMTGRLGRIGLLRWPGRADHTAVEAALTQVGLADQRDRSLGDLSGGQRQRAYLARAIAQGARLILLDEPMTGLDIPSQEAMYQVLEEQHVAGATLLVATHDLLALERFGFDRVLCLNQRLVADGPPATVLNEATLSATYGDVVHAVRRLLTANAAPDRHV
jgi:manganese/iron transport system ATP-binding protein